MTNIRLVKTNMDKNTASSLESSSNEHEPLAADRDEAPQPPYLDVGSSSVRVAHKEGIVPFEYDVYTEKYIVKWKLDHIMLV